ncbi:MAG: hypothetical protein LQ344_007138 [Seirophora lacunosa]|nr:MAG: hypothetical protein LQ344_007138 [Seirophora lacunosa]
MMDEATTNLILQLHWEDIKTLEFKGKGKESAGLSDAELALQFQQEEFERAVTRRADQRMAASIDRALLDDRVNLAVLADEERRASDDRKVACQLGGHANPADLQAPAVDLGNETLVEFGSSGTDNADGNNGSLSSPFESEVGESCRAAITIVDSVQSVCSSKRSRTNRFSLSAAAVKASRCPLYIISWAQILPVKWRRRPLSMRPPTVHTAMKLPVLRSSNQATSTDRRALVPDNNADVVPAAFARSRLIPVIVYKMAILEKR